MTDRMTLRSRALLFAPGAGAGVVAFVLALAATFNGHFAPASAGSALIPAIAIAVFCWAMAERVVAGTARSSWRPGRRGRGADRLRFSRRRGR